MLNFFRKKMSNRKGFTLVELLVVIAIIGILAAIAVPKFTSANESARGAKMQADLRTIDSAIAIANAQGKAASATQIADLVTAGYLTSSPPAPTGAWSTSAHSGTTGLSYSIVSGRAKAGSYFSDDL